MYMYTGVSDVRFFNFLSCFVDRFFFSIMTIPQTTITINYYYYYYYYYYYCFFPSLSLTYFVSFRRYSATKGLYTPMFFEPGDFCMAVYSEDEQWYRGRIEEHSDDVRLPW